MQKVFSLTDIDWEKDEDPFEEPKAKDKRIQKIIEETEINREKLIQYYESKLKEFPRLSGKVKAKIKIIKVFKGFKKAGTIETVDFSLNPYSMCPHPIESTINQEEAVWFQVKNAIIMTKVLPLKHESELKKQLKDL